MEKGCPPKKFISLPELSLVNQFFIHFLVKRGEPLNMRNKTLARPEE